MNLVTFRHNLASIYRINGHDTIICLSNLVDFNQLFFTNLR